jgi:hypothetical protein
MHRPLGRAWLVVYAPFSLAVARLHCPARLAARSFAHLGRRAGWPWPASLVRFSFFAFGAFWAAAKCAKYSCVLNLAKNLFVNKDSLFNAGGGKIFKRCFLLVLF